VQIIVVNYSRLSVNFCGFIPRLQTSTNGPPKVKKNENYEKPSWQTDHRAGLAGYPPNGAGTITHEEGIEPS
jgi:hypothetical protein